MFVSWQWGLLETWFRVASSKCFNCKTGAWTLFYVGLLSTAYWNIVQKLGCLRHLLVHPSATKIVFHLPRLKLPRLKFLLTARGSCLYCCPHPWFSVIYHFPLLLLRVVLKLHFIWKTWSHTTSADMICSIKASDVVQFLLFSPVGSSKLLFGSWISMYRWVASGYCLQ